MFKKAVLLAGILLAMVIGTADAQTRLRIAYPHFPPFHWLNEKNEMAGVLYEFMTDALEKRMGLTLVWTQYPWTRCQENLKNGTDDAIITVPTPERAAYTVTHKDPFFLKPLNLFTYADHPRLAEIRKIRKIADLKKGGFSVITYSGNGWHNDHVRPLGIKTYETAYLENVWIMLAEKRGDTVIEWPFAAWTSIRRLGLSDRIVDTSVTLASMPFHLLIRRDFPQAERILADFNATIARMKADGTLKAILSRYR